jgi:acetyl-CoA C-acetyltransferase
VAIGAGHFKMQILRVEGTAGRRQMTIEANEHPKPETTAEMLAALLLAFQKDGSVTAGNASGINDGASALVLASAHQIASSEAAPLAQIGGYAHAGVDPEIMGIEPMPAVRALLARSGLRIADFDVVESNESFASPALAVNRELGLNPAKGNPDGVAITLGHPVGATGALLAIKALSHLQRTGGRFGLITMCIGGGQGIAFVIERV